VSETLNLSPETAKALAAKAVEVTRTNLKVELDYSPRSMDRLDLVLEEFHDAKSSGRDFRNVAAMYGCYFGEVIIRNHGGTWRRTEETGFGPATSYPVVLELPDGMICNPLGKALKMIENGKEDSVAHLYRSLTSKSLRSRLESWLSGGKRAAVGPPADVGGLNWPTRPDGKGGVPALLQVMGSGPESLQALYLLTAMAEFKKGGWEVEQCQVVAKSPRGLFTIPCVVKRDDQYRLVFSHSGEWAEADYLRFTAWNERVRTCDDTKRVPIIIVHDKDPVILHEKGVIGERFGISLERVASSDP
jgi:hypothetical protein